MFRALILIVWFGGIVLISCLVLCVDGLDFMIWLACAVGLLIVLHDSIWFTFAFCVALCCFSCISLVVFYTLWSLAWLLCLFAFCLVRFELLYVLCWFGSVLLLAYYVGLVLCFGVYCLFFGVDWFPLFLVACLLLDLGLMFVDVWVVVCRMLRCLDVCMLVFLFCLLGCLRGLCCGLVGVCLVLLVLVLWVLWFTLMLGFCDLRWFGLLV